MAGEGGSARAPGARPLRVGLLLDSTVVAAWEHRAIEAIARSDAARIELVVTNGAAAARPSFGARLRAWRRQFLWLVYQRLDHAVMRRRVRRDAFAPADAAPLLADIPVLQVTPEQHGFVDRFPSAAVDAVRAAQLDVLVRFGFRILGGEILAAARCGVWSLHHGSNETYRGGPAFFWEVFHDDPVSDIVVQVLGDRLDAGRILYRSSAATYRNSVFMSRNPAFWKGSAFHARLLRDVHRRGWPAVTADEPYRRSWAVGPIRRTPTNGQMVAFGLRIAGRVVAKAWEKLTRRQQWFLAIRDRDGAVPGPWRLVVPPRDRFWADPHVLRSEAGDYVYFEDFPYRRGRGHIAVSRLEDGRLGPPVPALELPIHLSYPFVLEDGGEHFMIPETQEAGRIELYRAERLPDRWALDRVLVDGVLAVDATIVRWADRYWLFACDSVPGGESSDELCVYHAPALRGPWEPHAANPVVSDIRAARPAGRLFVEDGALIRPAQDCSVAYGRAIVLHRVEVLTPTEYRETPIDRIDGSEIPGNVGSHTLAREAEYELIDGRRVIRRWP